MRVLLAVVLVAALGPAGCRRAATQKKAETKTMQERLARAGIPVDVVFEQGKPF